MLQRIGFIDIHYDRQVIVIIVVLILIHVSGDEAHVVLPAQPRPQQLLERAHLAEQRSRHQLLVVLWAPKGARRGVGGVGRKEVRQGEGRWGGRGQARGRGVCAVVKGQSGGRAVGRWEVARQGDGAVWVGYAAAETAAGGGGGHAAAETQAQAQV